MLASPPIRLSLLIYALRKGRWYLRHPIINLSGPEKQPGIEVEAPGIPADILPHGFEFGLFAQLSAPRHIKLRTRLEKDSEL